MPAPITKSTAAARSSRPVGSLPTTIWDELIRVPLETRGSSLFARRGTNSLVADGTKQACFLDGDGQAFGQCGLKLPNQKFNFRFSQIQNIVEA